MLHGGKNFALLVLVVSGGFGAVACGDETRSGNVLDGAGAPDGSRLVDGVTASVDSRSVERGPVEVHTPLELATLTPSITLPVIFADADGTVALATVTDNAGVATGAVTIGGAVTVITPGLTGAYLRTLAGVAPSDVLEFLMPQGGPDQVQFGVTVPEVAATSQYSVRAHCGSGSSSGGYMLVYSEGRASCGATANLLAIRNPFNGPPEAILAHDVALHPSPILAEPWRPFGTHVVSVAGLLPSSRVATTMSSIDRGEHLDGRNLPNLSATTAPVDLTFAVPTGELDHQLMLQVVRPDGAEQLVVRRMASNPSSSLDVAMLPVVRDVQLDPVTRSVRWTQEGEPTFIEISIRYERDVGAIFPWTFLWVYVGPGLTSPFQLPELPPVYAEYGPGAADRLVSAQVIAHRTHGASGPLAYAQVRQQLDRALATFDREDDALLRLPGVVGFDRSGPGVAPRAISNLSGGAR